MQTKRKGSKHEVYHGKALRTAGGLTKADLILNRSGKVVSKKQSAAGKKRGAEALKKYRFKKKDAKTTKGSDGDDK